jgi:hypothetical protein
LLTGDVVGAARLMQRLAQMLQVPYLFGADSTGWKEEEARAKRRPPLRAGGMADLTEHTIAEHTHARDEGTRARWATSARRQCKYSHMPESGGLAPLLRDARQIKEMKPKYLNVDLQIYTARKPVALLREIADTAIVLYSGRATHGYMTNIELLMNAKTPDKTITRFHQLICSLSPASRREWDRARRRVFSIGYETTGTFDRCLEVRLSPQAVSLVADIAAELQTVLYREDERDREAP